MPVRSLNTSVLKWPDKEVVLEAVAKWALGICSEKNVVGVGYFGSYAEGRSGVGSDIDLIIVVKQSTEPFERRNIRFDTLTLPVAADLLVYTIEEFRAVLCQRGQFGRKLREATVWIKAPLEY